MLATFGLILFFNEVIKIIWGPAAIFTPIPEFPERQRGVIPGALYPVYRLAIIAVGLLVADGLYYVVARTRLGMLIRAGASNREMVGALGVNIGILYTFVFGLGAALAGSPA